MPFYGFEVGYGGLELLKSNPYVSEVLVCGSYVVGQMMSAEVHQHKNIPRCHPKMVETSQMPTTLSC